MIPYIALLFIIVILTGMCLEKKISTKTFVFISFFLMALLVGLRGDSVGEDTKMYLSIAQKSSELSWRAVLSTFPRVQWNVINYGPISFGEKIETLFLVYCKIIMLIFHNAQMVLLMTALITHILFARFIVKNVKGKSYICLATFVFLCGGLFMNSFNLMRQLLATAIAIQSLIPLKNKKYWRTVGTLLVAFFMHESAIVFLLVDLIYYMKDTDKKKYYPYVLALSLALPLFLNTIARIVSKALPRFAEYFTTSYWKASIAGTYVLWLFIAVIIVYLLLYKKKTTDDWNVIYIATIYLAIEIIGLKLTAISRVAMYFGCMFVIFYPYVLSRITKKNNRRVYNVILIMFLLILFFSYIRVPTRCYSLFEY